MRRTLFAAIVGGFLLTAANQPLAAQDLAPPSHVSFNTGLFQFKLNGDGYAPLLALRAATPINSVLVVEGAFLAARPGQDFATTTFLIPEAQVQLALPFEVITPYMGLGLGAAIDLRDGDAGGIRTVPTISGSIGLKSWFNEGVGIQGEFRGRGIDADFTGSASEYTIGLIWRI